MSMGGGFRGARYDTVCQRFAEAWVEGDTATALERAKYAGRLWEEAYGTRAREAAKLHGIKWPCLGCPEADDTDGWSGWYGGYAGTGV